MASKNFFHTINSKLKRGTLCSALHFCIQIITKSYKEIMSDKDMNHYQRNTLTHSCMITFNIIVFECLALVFDMT